MQHVAPIGQMYQAGTLSGNPLAMAAGIAALTELRKPGKYEAIEHKTQILGEGLQKAIHDSGIPGQIQRIGGLLCLFFTKEPVRDYASAKQSDTARFARYFWAMLSRGIYLPPSQFEAWFISLALEDTMIEETVQACNCCLASRKERIRLMSNFPIVRLRRTRQNERLRGLVRETHLRIDQLVYPLFIAEGINQPREIAAMPEIMQWPLEHLGREVERIAKLGHPGCFALWHPQ